jgi:hypothetical protein
MDHTAATQVLGGDVVIGCPALSKGQLSRQAGAAAMGGLAGVAISRLLQKNKTEESAPGGHIGSIYITLGHDRIAFFEQRNGLLGASLGRLLAAYDLKDIATCEWRPAKIGVSRLAIAAADGAQYELEVALVQKSKAQKIAQALESRPSRAA